MANDQRQVIYQQRNDLLEDEDISEIIENIREDVVNGTIDDYITPGSLDEQWDISGLERALETEFALKESVQAWLREDNRLDEEGVRQRVVEAVRASYLARQVHVGDYMREVERQIMLQVLDNLWKDHLSTMDQLRQSIGLRAYAQKNPKQEYKRESFALFEELLNRIKSDTIRFLSHVQVASQEDMTRLEEQRRNQQARREYTHGKLDTDNELATNESRTSAKTPRPIQRLEAKVGRNQACPCGSGKKYKQCCGKI